MDGQVSGVYRGRQPGQIRGARLISAPALSDNPTMAVVDSVHASLCEVVAEMMSAACGRAFPRSHLSFLALGGTETQAAELAQMVNALFGLSLPPDTIMRSPTPDALARTIAIAWFDGGGTAAGLLELIDALADAE